MSEDKILNIIKNEIHGVPEVRPEERKLFLSTLRERVYVTLTSKQVMQTRVYDQVNHWIQMVPDINEIQLYLNGHISYTYLSKYIKLATQNGCSYTIIQNNTHNSPLGLVLASQTKPVDKDEIFIKDENFDLL